MKTLTLSEKRKKIAEEEKRKNAKSPPQELLIKLLELYQNRSYEDAEKAIIQTIQQFPYHQFAWKLLAAVYKDTGKLTEALNVNKKAAELGPNDVEAHSNLGIILYELGNLEESIAPFKKAITIQSNYIHAHFMMGKALSELGRLEEGEVSLKKTIALQPDFSDAHCILGMTLHDLGRLDEAEQGYRQAIALKPDYVVAHCGLGITLKDLGRLDEAEAICRQALILEPDIANVYYTLGIILYGKGDIDSAITSIERANHIDPESGSYSFLLSVLQARKPQKTFEVSAANKKNMDCNLDLPRKVFMLERAVEEELLTCLYELKSSNLEKEKDPSFGNTRGSLYELFRDNQHHPIIKYLAEDFERILIKTFNSKIFVDESFFSIFGAGGGTRVHNHISSRDKDPILNLAKQKYSLVYYLSVGDQGCSEPGILKLYEPNKDILPTKGLITIFPSDRNHSSVYGGNKDRVIIGVNFYCL